MSLSLELFKNINQFIYLMGTKLDRNSLQLVTIGNVTEQTVYFIYCNAIIMFRVVICLTQVGELTSSVL